MEVTIPQKQGQVCKIANPMGDEDPEGVYLVLEDPRPFDSEDNIYVVNLKDLQRSLSNPAFTAQIAIAKNELFVLADSLEIYINSWNKKI